MLHAEHAKRALWSSWNSLVEYWTPGFSSAAELHLEIKLEFQKLFNFIINVSLVWVC